MSTSSPATEIFRVLLLRKPGEALLVRADDQSASLPVIQIPKHTRIAEESNQAVLNAYGVEAYCLCTRTLSEVPSSSFRLLVMQTRGPVADAPARTSWTPLEFVVPTTFRNCEEFRLVSEWVSSSEATRQPDFFTQPRFLTTVFEWVRECANSVAIEPTGEFRQLNCGPEFNLIRFAGEPKSLWFKAVGGPNRHEFSVTVTLAQLFTLFLPHVLGTRRDWNAWLACEAPGTPLGDLADLDSWKTAAAALARLQIGSIGQGLHLINAGCRDLRDCCLRSRLGPFLELAAELMAEQRTASPAPLSRLEIRTLGSKIEQAVETLAETHIPNTLGHGDPNPANLIIDGNHCVFLDWSEAFVGHPFLTISYLLEYLRRDAAKRNWVEPVLDVYAARFRHHFDVQAVDAACAVAPLLAAFAFASAIALPQPTAALPQADVTRLIRSLVRRMHREAQTLTTERILCVS
jgi:aminoglycoside phosphotransferase